MKADIQTIFANRTELVPRCIEAGTRGSLGLVKLRFEFSDEWDGSEKKVVFYPRRGRPIEVPYLSGEIDIPPEVMRYEGEASYVVSGTLISDGEVEAKSISLPGYIKVEFTLNDEGGNSRKVTPDTFDLFMTQSKGYMESVLRAAQESGAFDGVSVESVEQTHAAEGDGESNIITVKLQDGQEFPFAVKNGSKGEDGEDGRGIDRIERTSGDGSAGSVDEYTIYYTDGGTFKFTVTNGGSAGEGGYSPRATVRQTDDGAVIEVEDKNGVTTAFVSNGRNGAPGSNGTSPSVSVVDIDGGHRIIITDANGTQNVDVMDGADGETPKIDIMHFGGNDGSVRGSTTVTFEIGGEAKSFTVFDGAPYVPTEADKAAIAQEAAKLVDAPVKSVNGKTGAVTLGAADVGAATAEQFDRLSEEIGDLSKLSAYGTNITDIILKLISGGNITPDEEEIIKKALPYVRLNGDLTGISADDYVNVTCNFVDETNNTEFTDYAEIAWQGSSSVNFKKEIDGVDVAKNYKIKLYSDDARETKNKRTFKDWHATNNYHIKCNYADCTNFMNNMMMHYLTKTYQYLTPLPREGARYTVDGFPILLYINDVFCGIRFWNLKQDDKVYNLNENDLCYQVGLHDGTNQGDNSGAFVYGNLKNGQFADAHAEIDYYWEDRVWDKTNNHPAVLYDTIQWVSEATDEEFRTNLEQHFNKEYLINYFVMMYSCGMIDSKGKNFNMLYFPDKGVWYPTFWDMDNAFGTYYTMKTTPPNIELHQYGCPSSRLFDKLWANFKEECEQKYWELRGTILTVNQVNDSINAVWSSFVDESLIAENESTKYDGTSYDGMFKTDGKAFVTEWAEKRFAYMDIVMSFEISNTELTFTSFDSQTLTVEANTTEEIVWTSSNKGVATVDNGVVTPIKNGSCVITVTIGDFKATCNVTVDVVLDEEDGLYISGYIGDSGVVTAGTNEYTSTKYDEASGSITIDIRNILESSLGKVTPVRIAEYDESKTFLRRKYKGLDARGHYVASFELGESTRYVRVGFVTTLTDETSLNDLFTNYVISLTLSAFALTFDSPDSQTLTVTTNSSEQVLWTSDNTAVATVENGVVTPISKGTCKITATIGDMSAVCDITVGNILYENGYVSDNGVMAGMSGDKQYMFKKYHEASGNVTVSFANVLESTRSLISTVRYAEYDENKTFIKRGYKAPTNYVSTIALDANTRYVRIAFEFKSAVTDDVVLTDLFTNCTVTSG